MMIRAFLPVSFLCATLGGTPMATGTPRPNIIFVLTDDQGWAESAVPMHPGEAYSSSPYLDTPNMARLAKAGMRFTSGYASAPLCTPT